jgi:hypothetical protein
LIVSASNSLLQAEAEVIEVTDSDVLDLAPLRNRGQTALEILDGPRAR